jgi:hypothetical protein
MIAQMFNQSLSIGCHTVIAQTNIVIDFGYLIVFLMHIDSHTYRFTAVIDYVSTFGLGFGCGGSMLFHKI